MEHKKPLPRDISSFGLHLLAMGLMLCDHLWATVVPGNEWMTWLGRLAFPIFAFLLAEGCRHTGNIQKYRRRLLVCALLAELPFNLMYTASWIFPFHQNVLWTFLLALLCLEAVDTIRARFRPWLAWPLAAAAATGFALAAQLAMTDYGGSGVLTVLVFYLFRGNGWVSRLGQLLGLTVINWRLVQGMVMPVSLLGLTLEIPQQGAAVLALIPLWCYRGRQGHHSKAFQYVCYGFYPAHMLLLGLLSR